MLIEFAVELSVSLPRVCHFGIGFRFGFRRCRIAARLGIVIVFGRVLRLRILGQHLFGAVQRVRLPNAAAVAVQVVLGLAPLVTTVHIMVLLLVCVVPRVRPYGTRITAASHASLPVIVVVVAIGVLPIVVIGVVMTTAAVIATAAHLSTPHHTSEWGWTGLVGDWRV